MADQLVRTIWTSLGPSSFRNSTDQAWVINLQVSVWTDTENGNKNTKINRDIDKKKKNPEPTDLPSKRNLWKKDYSIKAVNKDSMSHNIKYISDSLARL